MSKIDNRHFYNLKNGIKACLRSTFKLYGDHKVTPPKHHVFCGHDVKNVVGRILLIVCMA